MFSFERGNPGALAPCTTNVWWDVAGVNGLQNFDRKEIIAICNAGSES
jgi:hypothetical protein